MPLAVTDVTTAPIGAELDFDASIQRLEALEAAAYRLIGSATCQVERKADRFICKLTLNPTAKDRLNEAALKVRFLDLVTDENLRLRIAGRTDGARNVILALAFGSLAEAQDG
ncbi:hypothetical protein IVB25_23480 [Bradyrhizobium sp. 193]|uniref:hypothetical protein n=1 Tax=Bradyrhizobium sp. 193 TaxID=2782661 RepID=UPI001FF9269F|nr:hypothetical protein [Bradyrhizobium sp. 193]MCK1485571.1 hypothetical protein [Bradyrhizobium sp. 193]